MKDKELSSQSSNIVVATLMVVVLTLGSALLLLSAFIIWFAEVINSLPLSLIITSAVLGVIALATYKATLSPALKKLRAEYNEFMTIVTIVKYGYTCAKMRLLKLFQ